MGSGQTVPSSCPDLCCSQLEWRGTWAMRPQNSAVLIALCKYSKNIKMTIGKERVVRECLPDKEEASGSQLHLDAVGSDSSFLN